MSLGGTAALEAGTGGEDNECFKSMSSFLGIKDAVGETVGVGGKGGNPEGFNLIPTSENADTGASTSKLLASIIFFDV